MLAGNQRDFKGKVRASGKAVAGSWRRWRFGHRHSERFLCLWPVTVVKRILDCVRQGEAKAAKELLPLAYDELRKLAATGQ